MAQPEPAAERYARQIILPQIGPAGQEALTSARVVLIGCGALGSAVASTLVRAGVGYLRICDRDFLELSNLQRQTLFDEGDLRHGLPKAVAAAEKLALINSTVHVEAQVIDVNPQTVMAAIDGIQLILDGTDNFETRYLLNDVALRQGIPWIYGAVLGTAGLIMPIIPAETMCLRCVLESAPPPESNPTCESAGVLGPAASVVAALQCVEALRILTGGFTASAARLTSIDVWSGRMTHIGTARGASRPVCPCCDERRFAYLEGAAHRQATQLCGQNTVQITPPHAASTDPDLPALALRLQSVPGMVVHCNKFMVQAELGPHKLSVFPDGRAIIKGAESVEEARSVYARYVGA